MIGAVLLLLTVGTSRAYADDAPGLGSFPTIVNPQISDVLTSSAVQILPNSPTLVIGDRYLQTARALGPAYNAAPDAVAHSVTLDSGQVRFLLDDNASTIPQRQETLRELLAIGERFEDCAQQCVLNIQVHVLPSSALSATTDAISAVSSAVDLISEDANDVDGIGWVIPDGDLGDGVREEDSGSAVLISGQYVTSLDILLQRDLDITSGGQVDLNPDNCPLRPYANCSYMNLDGLNLSDLDLTGIDLTGASIRGTNLTRAKLGQANFSDALISDSKFHRADMRGAVFRNASARTADFAGANLQRADFFGAELREQSFAASADLSGATWSNGVTCRTRSIGTCWQPN